MSTQRGRRWILAVVGMLMLAAPPVEAHGKRFKPQVRPDPAGDCVRNAYCSSFRLDMQDVTFNPHYPNNPKRPKRNGKNYYTAGIGTYAPWPNSELEAPRGCEGPEVGCWGIYFLFDVRDDAYSERTFRVFSEGGELRGYVWNQSTRTVEGDALAVKRFPGGTDISMRFAKGLLGQTDGEIRWAVQVVTSTGIDSAPNSYSDPGTSCQPPGPGQTPPCLEGWYSHPAV